MPTSLLYAVICASWGDWGAAVAAAKTTMNTRSCKGKSKSYLLYRVAIQLLPDRADGSENVSFTFLERVNVFKKEFANLMWRLYKLYTLSYRISRSIRHTFFPKKCDLNSTCVLCVESIISKLVNIHTSIIQHLYREIVKFASKSWDLASLGVYDE
jgi:hypothetical protein